MTLVSTSSSSSSSASTHQPSENTRPPSTYHQLCKSPFFEAETEYFGFTPSQFIDDVVASVNQAIEVVTTTLQENLPPNEASLATIDKFKILLENKVDIYFERFEDLCLADVFSLPPQYVPAQLENIDLSLTEEDDKACDVELEELEKKLKSVKWASSGSCVTSSHILKAQVVNSILQSELERGADAIKQFHDNKENIKFLETLDNPTVDSFPENLSLLSDVVHELKTVLRTAQNYQATLQEVLQKYSGDSDLGAANRSGDFYNSRAIVNRLNIQEFVEVFYLGDRWWMGASCSCGRKRVDVASIIMFGLDSAGKTAILSKMSGTPFPEDIPTIGYNQALISTDNAPLEVVDLGGGSVLRSLWRNYVQDAACLLFVVDSSDTNRLLEAKKELATVTPLVNFQEARLLVFAHKQDVSGALAVQRVEEELGLQTLVPAQRYKIVGTSINEPRAMIAALSFFQVKQKS